MPAMVGIVAFDKTGTLTTGKLSVARMLQWRGGEEAMLAELTDRVGALGFAIRAAVADTPGAAGRRLPRVAPRAR